MDGFSHDRKPRNQTGAEIKSRYGACFSRACLALLLFFSCAAAPAWAQTLDVIPAPATVAPGDGLFAFRADTWISLPRDPRVARIARYFAGLLEETSGVRMPIADESMTATTHSVIEFRLDPSSPHTSPEGYEINIAPARLVVSAADTRGLFYGAVTLWQLCTTKGAFDSGAITVHAGKITDSPRLAWRGLMLDSARHYQSPEFIIRFIDWMALHKLNVFHWHLTDDQGWRLEIKKYPRLTEVGAWRVPAGAAAAGGRYGGFYSQDDVRRIVAHAAERNITVVPEIDMPGHASAAIVAYPQLGVTDHPPTAVPSDWGMYSNLYNVDESTFNFLDDVLDEVMTLFPGEYIHVGGDEAVKDQWKASPRVQARMRELHVADERALQSYFIQRIEKHLAAHGRRLIGWDEILEGGIAPEATIMSWRGLDGAVAAAGVGHDTVLSPWPILYFDNRQGSSAAEPPGRGRVLSLQEVYGFDPMPAGIAPEQRRHVLGLQANVWTEHIRTEDRVEYMTFPRAAAVAEIGWSPPQMRNWDDFRRRLPSEFARYREVGLRYSDDALKPAPAPLGQFDRHASQDLQTCTDKVVLSLEDDAPVQGHRAIFLIDIENPCWLFPSVDLSRGLSLQAAVGQVPFNYQIGKDRDAIQLAPPQTAAGELEVYLDGCTNGGPTGPADQAKGAPGRRIAVLPLAPAVGNDAVTELPSIRLPPARGRHDLCFRFTQRTLDPLWALDWVQLRE
jgi:hexosaminidase